MTDKITAPHGTLANPYLIEGVIGTPNVRYSEDGVEVRAVIAHGGAPAGRAGVHLSMATHEVVLLCWSDDGNGSKYAIVGGDSSALPRADQPVVSE